MKMLYGVAEGCVVLFQGLVFGGDSEKGDENKENGGTEDKG